MSYSTVCDFFTSFITETLKEFPDISEDQKNQIMSKWEDQSSELKKLFAKKKKEKKDKNAPKGAKSGYMFFCEENRPTVKEQKPELKAPEILKHLALMWKDFKQLHPENKKYDDLASKDKERYKKEMENYLPPTEEEMEKKEKKKKDKNAPKRPRSAYSIFSVDEREVMKAEGKTSKEILSGLGERWQLLKEKNPSKVSKYEKLAEKDKERYKKEMETYVPSDEEIQEKKKKEAIKKDKNAPKKARTAYAYFSQHERKKIKAEGNGLTTKEMTTELARRWKVYKGKKPANKYTKLADEDKKRYKEEMENYVPRTEEDDEDKDDEVSDDESDVDYDEKDEGKVLVSVEEILGVDNEKDEKKNKKSEKKTKKIVREMLNNADGDHISVKKILKELETVHNIKVDKVKLMEIITEIQEE